MLYVDMLLYSTLDIACDASSFVTKRSKIPGVDKMSR